MLLCSEIYLGGLQLYPSENYSATLSGIMDFTKTISSSDLYYDGEHYGHSKINSKDLTLTVMVKNQYSYLEKELEQHLNYILQQENIKLQFRFDDMFNKDELFECLVNCTSRANDMDGHGRIVANLHLSSPYIYGETKVVTLEKQMTGGFYFNDSTGFEISSEGFHFEETVIGNTAEIYINGNTVYPLITIEGQANNFRIINRTTGEVLKINYQTNSYDKMVINCRPESRSVKLDKVSLIKYKSGQFLSLVNGSNDIIVEYDGDCAVKFEYKERL